MASSSDPPDLSALLRGARSSRGRMRGRGRGGGTIPGPEVVSKEAAAHAQDNIVQQTDQDASVSRMSAVNLHYLDDPFAAAFVSDTQARRFPIINRGTYVRTSAIDQLVNSFLLQSSSSTKQIISLGAGSDTRFFRLQKRHPSLKLIYHELDFPAITSQKISSIQRSSDLQSLLHPSSSTSTSKTLYSASYNIHAVDLRNLTATTSLPNLSPDTPTLLISECCLVYLSPEQADKILDVFVTALLPPSTPLGLLLYEPINPLDAFGQVMVSNLLARGLVLPTLKKYGSLVRQRERLRARGFTTGQAVADVDFLWREWIAPAEKERVARLEMLDELEEWTLLARHYCVAWGWRTGQESHGETDRDRDFRGWRALSSQAADGE